MIRTSPLLLKPTAVRGCRWQRYALHALTMTLPFSSRTGLPPIESSTPRHPSDQVRRTVSPRTKPRIWSAREVPLCATRTMPPFTASDPPQATVSTVKSRCTPIWPPDQPGPVDGISRAEHPLPGLSSEPPAGEKAEISVAFGCPSLKCSAVKVRREATCMTVISVPGWPTY